MASTKTQVQSRKKVERYLMTKKAFKTTDIDIADLEDDLSDASDDDVNYNELSDYEDTTKDINKNKGASLWKIIKVRYKKSAWDDLLPKKENKSKRLRHFILALLT